MRVHDLYRYNINISIRCVQQLSFVSINGSMKMYSNSFIPASRWSNILRKLGITLLVRSLTRVGKDSKQG